MRLRMSEKTVDGRRLKMYGELTSYFRDLLFNGETDKTKINLGISFERHVVLNWLRKFMDIEE